MSNAASIRWFVPETITHLYYSPVYATLSARQKLAYNRLHACYLCELFVYFEETFPRYYRNAARRAGVPDGLRAGVERLEAAEGRHAEMFRALARHLAPDLYTPFRFHFIGLPRAAARVLEAALMRPWYFPALFWVVMMQEERAIYYAGEILRSPAPLDPEVVEAQRLHLADEAEHLGVDEELLDFYWERNHGWIRKMNAELLRLAVREFLVTPKRGGVRVVEQWIRECPELRPRKNELAGAMRALDREPGFHESLYSRRIVPRTFAHFDRYEELRRLAKSLRGYCPEAAS